MKSPKRKYRKKTLSSYPQVLTFPIDKDASANIKILSFQMAHFNAALARNGPRKWIGTVTYEIPEVIC